MVNLDLNHVHYIFFRYIVDSWIEGPFPPYTWNCFGRVEDCTNNAQEAFNGILNRLVKVRNVEKASKLLLV